MIHTLKRYSFSAKKSLWNYVRFKYSAQDDDSILKSKRYSKTLNLPHTAFPLTMKNGAGVQREMDIQKTSSFQSLYLWQREQNWSQEFVLHDGPPYANGKPHVGHMVNKVLKDITNRYKVLKRQKVHFRPGWDCHGMPIEIKAITDKSGKHLHLSPLEIRMKAKMFAEKTLTEQKKTFQQWGIMGDWKNVYKTLTPDYESNQLDVFYKIYKKGDIYRDYMPVFWSPSSQSALAEAELEYNTEHISKSVYVKFPSSLPQFSNYFASNSQIYAVIWTTTPWTLPFNQAVCYSPKTNYILAHSLKKAEVYLCEEKFFDKLKQLVTSGLESMLTVEGSQLHGSLYVHPLNNKILPFLPSSHVLEGKGTGLVHIAPAHGHDDFNVALQHNLSKECHVDDKGTFVSGVDASLLGKTVGVDADEAVIAALGEHLIKTENYLHSYPYDWRTKQPIIIRASKQWFIDLRRLRPLALQSLSLVKIIPQKSERGMIAELNTRPYWCISRQRAWGVPIPVFYHKDSDEPLITSETIDHLKQLVLKHGTDCWWSLPVDQLLPAYILKSVKKGESRDYIRGSDILDIWFDSGVSWASVLQDCGGKADVYMEGIDQYKGWFQTSLLTSVAVRGEAPYKQIITHGFTTDEEGKKMSKSIGNVVDPEEVIFGGKERRLMPSYGVDVLRWWVAHSHHHLHIMIGPSILEKFHEDVFKVRKCIRHLLGNLFDFNPSTDLMDYTEMNPVDKYFLYILYTSVSQMEEAYETFTYHRVIQLLEKFFYSDLSSFYIKTTRDSDYSFLNATGGNQKMYHRRFNLGRYTQKGETVQSEIANETDEKTSVSEPDDRITKCYCNAAADKERKSCQTVLYYVVKHISAAFAPILPHLAEEIFSHLPKLNSETDSIFKIGWCYPDKKWNNSTAVNKLLPVFDIRQTLIDKLALENPVEFDILIYSSPLLHDLFQELQPAVTSSTSPLCEIFQTSQVSVLNSPPPVIPDDSFILEGSTVLQTKESSSVEVDYKILVTSAQLHMCKRCRRYTAKTTTATCDRCLHAMANDWAT